MDVREEAVGNESEVRRTRSGRAVRTPSATPAKTAGRKKKKMVLVEVEVSDEEEVADHTEPKTDQPMSQGVELENSDNANEAVEIQQFVSSDNNEIDNCSNTAQFPEESVCVINELNSFKGAIICSERVELSENDIELEDSVDAENNVEESSMDKAETVEAEDTGDTEVLLEDVSLQQNESNTTEVLEASKTNFENEKNEIAIDKEEQVESIEPVTETETQGATKEESSTEQMEINADVEQPPQPMQIDDPDTEVISEDELPGVQVAKVPETEEVSDEELPGPKRAELPADTEVVSEDELPTIKNKRKLAEGDYDPGSPTSENETPVKKPALDADVEKEKEDKTAKPKKLPTLDKYWKAVNDDPADFTGWTYLLQYVDQENDMEAAREAYDAFLSHYPYCYGYWRKYADYEKRKGNKKKCEEVFERGLKAIPLSVDLWIHYLTYVRTSRPDDEDFIRSQFERALSACGLEFRSDRLWDSYIKWETESKRLQHVTAIYDRLLATPTQGYTTHFDNFQEHIASHSPNKVLEVDEFLALRKEMKHMLKNDAATDGEGETEDVPPGEDESKIVSSDEEAKVIRERIVSIRRKIHKNTVNAVTARWNFEEGIKRPYFHVKPLERCQLKNWQDYLDFEIEQGDQVRIVVLFERCLIACALYEEFWLRFVLYLENRKDPSLQPKIKDVYERACTIHHLKKPNLHLQWAMFEESILNFNRAAEILVNLEKSVPNLLQVAYRRINLERRRADFEKCCQLYEHYMSTTKNKVIASNLAIKFARFQLKVLKDLDKAMEVLNTAISKDPNNARLYLQLIDFTLQKEEFTETEILSCIDAFLEKEGIDIEQKILFAQRKLEFLEDFGSNIQAIQKAQEEYQKYAKLTKDMKKKESSKVDTALSKKEKNPPLPSSQANSYNYGNYSNSTNSGAYNQYSGAQQGQYNYAQYGQGDQYQYQNWQYPQSGYGSYNQWSGYSGGYGY